MTTVNRSDLEQMAQGINELVDREIKVKALASPSRQYLGASSLGDACCRKLQYQYLNIPVDTTKEISARTNRIFQRGHLMEDMIAGWINDAGFELVTHNYDGKQLGFSSADGRLKGHVDGVVTNGPTGYSYPFLWENKALGNRSWKEISKTKLAISRPVYAAQMAIYQAYMGLHENPGLFTAINADTMEIYSEFVPFNGELAQRSSDRGVRILEACDANDWLPRIAKESSHFECKFCSWQKRCWGGNV